MGDPLAVLDEPTPEMRKVRDLLCEEERFPSKRTFYRRLKASPCTHPEQIGFLRRHLVEGIKPWESREVALDSTPL